MIRKPAAISPPRGLNNGAGVEALVGGDERFEKSRRVMSAVDEINARHGRELLT